MTIIGLIRAKNEARWIGRVIRSLYPLCLHVIVMDDHSTDFTAQVSRAHGGLVLPSPFEGFDETRDKNWFLQWAMRGAVFPVPDWIVMIDGDEILEEGSHAKIAKALADHHGTAEAYSFEVVYLWNDELHVRTDLRTFCRRRASMFRPKPGARFVSPYPQHGLHCGNVPFEYNSIPIPARLLHLGYMHKEDRIRKWEWYNKLDPANVHEDCYRHMIIGDTDELPATAVTKWGGPLKLEAL